MLNQAINGVQVKRIRKRLRLNQQAFWSAVGVTQSAGSRYESGSTMMPVQIAELIRICYIENIPLSRVKSEYVNVALALKERDNDTYQALKNVVNQQSQALALT
jgi:transcriptional regulator with XRE-family HTH domain